MAIIEIVPDKATKPSLIPSNDVNVTKRIGARIFDTSVTPDITIDFSGADTTRSLKDRDGNDLDLKTNDVRINKVLIINRSAGELGIDLDSIATSLEGGDPLFSDMLIPIFDGAFYQIRNWRGTLDLRVKQTGNPNGIWHIIVWW
jgi:hypothetical protein